MNQHPFDNPLLPASFRPYKIYRDGKRIKGFHYEYQAKQEIPDYQHKHPASTFSIKFEITANDIDPKHLISSEEEKNY